MRITNYNDFVRRSDQYGNIEPSKRRNMAIYGVVGAIGTLFYSIRRQSILEVSDLTSRSTIEEIKDQMGNIIWYCFRLSQTSESESGVDFLSANIQQLKIELSSEESRSRNVENIITTSNLDTFFREADSYLNKSSRYFSDYQSVSVLTARTENTELLRTCLYSLWQLGAELLQTNLPEIEATFRGLIASRSEEVVLGEVLWHIAAIASLYDLALDDIVNSNVKKIDFRFEHDAPTPLHDQEFPDGQRFPRKFEIKFLTIGDGRSRMYLDGSQVGDDLTDNSYEPDGYRFHDVLHLSNVAHMGWSPVIRRLLQLKRKNNPEIDEVEDGARARIIEEAIIKAIHSEGTRLVKARNSDTNPETAQLFAESDEISFAFLKFVRTFVEGLEVYKNTYWEWENSIRDGYRIYHELCREEQGTVILDLDKRTIDFRPDAYVDLKGAVGGIGSCMVTLDDRGRGLPLNIDSLLTSQELEQTSREGHNTNLARIFAIKVAIFESLGYEEIEDEEYPLIEVTLLDNNRVSIKSYGEVQKAIWREEIVSFKTTIVEDQRNVFCTVLSISGPTTR